MFFIFNILVPLFRPSLYRMVLFFLYLNLRKQPLEVSCRKRCLKILANLTGKHLFWTLFFSDLDLQLYYQEILTQVFSCEICKISKNTYFEEHLRTTASEFIGDTTLLNETVLKKHTNGKTNFQDDKEYNQK